MSFALIANYNMFDRLIESLHHCRQIETEKKEKGREVTLSMTMPERRPWALVSSTASTCLAAIRWHAFDIVVPCGIYRRLLLGDGGVTATCGRGRGIALRHGDGLVQEEDVKQGSASGVRDEQAKRTQIGKGSCG